VKRALAFRYLKLVIWLVVPMAILIHSCKPESDNIDLSTGASSNKYVVEKPYGFGTFYDNTSYPMTVEGVDLGRHLFYDSILSVNYTISCGSCHKQSLAFTDDRQFSMGVHGGMTDRNSMPLYNVGFEQGPFFWDGRALTLEEQIEQPVFNPIEMDLSWEVAVERLQNSPMYQAKFKAAFGLDKFGKPKISKQLAVVGMAQFIRSIVSGNSKYDQYAKTKNFDLFTPLEQKGFDLFTNDPKLQADTRLKAPGSGVDCGHCHTFPLFQQEANLKVLRVLMNNGTISLDNGQVRDAKVPSLRNLSYTAPYGHDGQFKTIDDIVKHYNDGSSKMNKAEYDALDDQMYIKLRTRGNPNTMEMDQNEVSALKAFIKTLDDPTLLTNPAYSNPFRK